jgi:hypothetical protein
MEPFHIFLLLIGLSGQPIGVYGFTGSPSADASFVDYPTKEACEAALPAAMKFVQERFDTSSHEEVRGKVAVADGKCATDSEMNGGNTPKAKPSNLRGA